MCSYKIHVAEFKQNKRLERNEPCEEDDITHVTRKKQTSYDKFDQAIVEYSNDCRACLSYIKH